MKYQIFSPPIHLDSIVRFFWFLEGSASPDKPFSHTSMASNSPEIIFHTKGRFVEIGDKNFQFYSLLHAQSQKVRTFVTTENFAIFGAYIFPSAIPLLFDTPSYLTTNLLLSLDELVNSRGKFLEEQIMESKTLEAKLDVLISFIENKLKHKSYEGDIITTCLQFINKSNVNLKVAELAEQFNLSLRQLERKFKVHAGFSPKTYLKITRFQHTLKHYNPINPKSLTEIALDCGYYDQSHFIHDFTAFSGFHPKQYFSSQNLGQEYR